MLPIFLRRRSTIPIAIAFSVLLLCGLLWAGQATRALLGGPERYLTHVSTDKPIYRPGEFVYVRGVVLHAHTKRPLKQAISGLVEIKGPKGERVTSGHINTQDSVFGFRWQIPQEQSGGPYKINITSPHHGFAPAQRKFDIRAYRAPRLVNHIVFMRDGYGPSDLVQANLNTQRAEGGIPKGAQVTVIARVDGAEVYRGSTTIDERGNCLGRFRLPAKIERGEGTLAFAIQDGGVVETATKTIPILLQTVDLQIFPEGGDLVAGLSTRIYLQARTPANKPADIAGVVVDSQGNSVARFRTQHEGRGRFRLPTAAGQKYTLKITQPSGIRRTFALPQVKIHGAIIQTRRNHYQRRRGVGLRVGTTRTGKHIVTLRKREREVARQEVDLQAYQFHALNLKPTKAADGVLIATLWNHKGQPLAERLVFVDPVQAVQIQIKADKKQYVPGERVELELTTTDGRNRPISAVVGLTVSDHSVQQMIEKREQAPRLPVMVLLEGEVFELADAHIYLDRKNKKAPLALDLLLGTQGWRRFALMDTAAFIRKHGQPAQRVLALRIQSRHDFRSGPPVKLGARRPRPKNRRRKFRPASKRAPKRQAKPNKKRPARAREAKRKQQRPQASRPQPIAPAAPQEQLAKAIIMADRDEARADLGLQMEKEIQRPVYLAYYRQYAHSARPNRQPSDRIDFSETLFWSSAVKTDPNTGLAKVSFALSDSVTSFSVMADAFDAKGRLGMATSSIKSVEPFYIEPKLPLEVSAGDEIDLPVAVVNSHNAKLKAAELHSASKGDLDIEKVAPFDLLANQRIRRTIKIRVGPTQSATDLVLEAKAGAYRDKVTRPVRIQAVGFPVELAYGGMLDQHHPAKHLIEIPDGVVPSSVSSTVVVYPTPLANLTQALQRLIREPSGCFEQTSSTTYPLVMAQQYFVSHTGVDPTLVERSAALLDKGYKRLTGFECKEHGYEWFGQDPGHEALTAYGLMEFSDMAQVRPVDQNMVERTRKWLLSSRDGSGGFSRKRRALHTWVAEPDCSNGYILWSLLESGEPASSLKQEIQAYQVALQKSTNSYAIALGANVMALANRGAVATSLMKRLAKQQTKEGQVDGATMSIVGSGGQALLIETTALAALAWMRDDAFAAQVEKSIQYLAASCKAGRYGSTQSTVLALRAIVTYDKKRARPKQLGSVRVFVDGQAVGGAVKFDKNTQGAIKLPDIMELLDAGKHQVVLKMTGGSSMPYSMAVDFNTRLPRSDEQCKVQLGVQLASKQVREGGITEAKATVQNRTKQTLPMVVAIVGLPGGLEPRHDRLKELVAQKQIAAYEVRGREVILYWRSMKPREKKVVNLSLVAAVPGRYTGPASRAYQYYTDEHKHWVGGLKLSILSK